MGPRCPGCGAYGDVPGLCEECAVKAASPRPTVRWYCHACHKTHEHTPAERDAHRDDLRSAEAAAIAARAHAKADSSAPGGAS